MSIAISFITRVIKSKTKGRDEADVVRSSGDRPENATIPKLPVAGAQSLAPTEEVPSPSVGLPKPKKPDEPMSQSDLIALLAQLATRSSDASKPRTKEADSIKLPDMPTPESCRSWKNQVKDEVRSASDQPDAAWLWLNEVYDVNKPRKELEATLQDPGVFTTLDTKLSAALTHEATQQ